MAKTTTIRMIGAGENFEKARRLMSRNKAEFTRMTRFDDGRDEEAVPKFIIEGNVRKKKVGGILTKLIKVCDDVVVGE